jgi:mono/diheme cytochrome c family protein
MKPIKLDRIARNMTLLVLLLVTAPISAGQNPIKLLGLYREQGASQPDTKNGKTLWYSSVNNRSCSNCHGANPRQSGKHVKTAKTIKPMAVSENPERYRDSKKVEKWFYRNCKWTFGRQCNTQEKADILSWLLSQ